jgi:microtubule-associated protein-like 6
MTNSDSDEPRAKPAEPAQRGRGLVRRLIGGRTQAPAKAAEPDGTAERAAAASAEPQAAGEDGQDSDVDAEERELHPRRPLVRWLRLTPRGRLQRATDATVGAVHACLTLPILLALQPLEGPVDRSTENGFLASQPCRAVSVATAAVSHGDRGARGGSPCKRRAALRRSTRLMVFCSQGLIAPTSHQTLYNAQEAPEHALELDHVHGYRGYDSRHNLLYASDGRVIYPAGATCVLHDPSTHDQTHFCGHEDDVLCVALHPDGDIVASGTAGAEPAVCVWSASSGQLLAELRGFHRRGVIVLAFDATGERLVTCGLDDQHSVAVYDWRTQRLLASSPGTGRALVAGFSPLGGRLVSGGAGHFSFWSTVGAAMSPAEASYGRFSVNSNPTVTGLGWHPDGGAVTGSTTGAIYRWRTDSEACLWCCPGAHAGPVHDITFTGDVLASGGKDGRILIWAPAAMRRVDCIDLRIASAQELDAGGRAAGACVGRAPVVRSLFASADGARMLVGTATGEAWELDVRAPGSWRSGCSLLFAVHGPGTPLLDGRPPMPRACGLDAHPSELAFATVGDDATLRQWDCVQRTCTMRRQLPAPGVAVKFAPDARSLAVGLSDGRLLVLDAANGLQTKQVAHRRDPLAVLAFSPQGRWLAAGADDGAIDLCVGQLVRAAQLCLDWRLSRVQV